MRKVLLVFVIAFGFAACNEGGTDVNVQTDSLKNELDTLGAKIGDKAGQVWDSTKTKAAELRADIEARFDSAGRKKDTTGN